MDFVLIINVITLFNLFALSVILLLKRPIVMHNLVLSLLVFIPGVAVLFNTLLYYDLAAKYSVFLFLTFNLNMLWSPAFFLYVLLMTGYVYKFRLAYLVHLIPLCISLFVFTPVMFMPKETLEVFLVSSKTVLPWQYNLVNNMLALQCIGYIIPSAITLVRYNRAIKNLFSDIQRISVFWLQGLILVGLILFITIFPPIIYFKKLDYFLMFLPVGLNCVYLFIVFKTLSTPVLFTHQVREVLRLKNEVELQRKGGQSTFEIKDHNTIFGDVAESLSVLFREHRPYLNPDLNIKLLSDQSGHSVHILSATINQHFGQNFYDYVNGYRVAHAQNLLSESGSDKYKIETLAVESGFRSRSVFYTAFKKKTGFTPSEYRSRLKNSTI